MQLNFNKSINKIMKIIVYKRLYMSVYSVF